MTRAELVAWGQRATPGPRLRVVLLAGAACGVTAITSISTPPGERELAAALDREPRCLVATLEGRHHRRIDIALCELGARHAFASALPDQPELALVAPPGGDLLQLGSSTRAEIAAVVHDLQPRVLVGLGNRAIAGALVGLAPLASGVPHHLATDVARPGELRRAMVEGLRIWLGTGVR